MYDAEIGRFLGVDPLASKFQGWSTYNYVLGNPVSLIDKDGRAPSGPGKGLLRKIRRSVGNFISGMVNKLTRRAARHTVKVTKKALDNISLEPKIEVTQSLGLQGGAEIDKGGGVLLNEASFVLSRATLSGKLTSTEGFQNTSGCLLLCFDETGKFGKSTIRSSFDANFGDGLMGAGFSLENEVDTQDMEDGSIQVTRHVVEGDIGASYGLINGSVGAGVNTVTDESFLKLAIGSAFEAALGYGVKVEAKVELKYNFD